MKQNNKAGFTEAMKKSKGDQGSVKCKMGDLNPHKGYSDAEHQDIPEIIGMMGIIRRKGMGR